MTLTANEELESRLIDLRRGLHRAMDELINRGDQAETEVILRQLDQHLTITINQIKRQ